MPVVHRAGSRAGAIEGYVRAWIAQYRGTPSLIAVFASQALGFRVTRHDVSHALHNLGVVSKTVSPTPGFSDAWSRAHYLTLMNTRLVNCMQVVWIDEKKIKDGEFAHRFQDTGYAPPGTRLAPQFCCCSLILMLSFPSSNPFFFQSQERTNPPSSSALRGHRSARRRSTWAAAWDWCCWRHWPDRVLCS